MLARNQASASTRTATSPQKAGYDFTDALVRVPPPPEVIAAIKACHEGKIPPELHAEIGEAQLRLPMHLAHLLAGRITQRIGPQNIFFTGGVRDAIMRVLEKSDRHRLMTMSPCFPGYRQAAEQQTLPSSAKEKCPQDLVVDVPLHREKVSHMYYSMDLARCARILEDPQSRIGAVIIAAPNTPTGQFPIERELRQLAELCAQHHVKLIIDTTFDIFETVQRYSGPRLSLESVLYVGSLVEPYSLSQFDLHLGFIAGPASFLDRLQRRTFVEDLQGPQRWPFGRPTDLARLAAYRVVRAEPYREECAQILRARHAFVESTLKSIPSLAAISPPIGAAKLLQFKPGFCENKVMAELKAAGIEVKPGSIYGMRDALRISLVAEPDEARFKEGIARLAHASVWGSPPSGTRQCAELWSDALTTPSLRDDL